MKHKLLILTAAVAVVSLALFSFASAMAANPLQTLCDNPDAKIDTVNVGCPESNPDKLPITIGNVVTYAMWAVGAMAVIFLIIGGMKFAMSGGDAEKVKKAKSTILYSVIGLALAILASTIISLVSSIPGELAK
jgi:hypothetical protein